MILLSVWEARSYLSEEKNLKKFCRLKLQCLFFSFFTDQHHHLCFDNLFPGKYACTDLVTVLALPYPAAAKSTVCVNESLLERDMSVEGGDTGPEDFEDEKSLEHTIEGTRAARHRRVRPNAMDTHTRACRRG